MKTLAWIQIFHGAVLLAAGLGVAGLLAAASVYVGRRGGGGEATAMAVPMLGLLGKGLLAVALLLSVPRLVVGVGLLRLRPWARSLALVIATFGFIDFPVGTVTGGYAYWVLLSKETIELFGGGAVPPPLPPTAGIR